MRTTARILVMVVLACLSARARVPPPSETPCEVVMSGRTITLKSIKIVAVGQEIPETYSSSVKNTPGMSWYVSQHYALKTDHGEGTARQFLTYAELAYPFHVWILGRHPENEDRLRMPFVMGTTFERMLDAVQDDSGGWRPGGIGGGGITYWGINVAYNYPSGTPQYHQRDLVIHENLHLMQMSCGSGYPPHRFLEGITHTSCNHVHDDARNQLTLAVFDKPTVNMPTTAQLRQIRKDYKTFREVCQKNIIHICLFTSFMWSDPERLMKWRLWRDAMLWEGRAGEDIKVTEEIFGSLDGQIERDWKAWLDARQPTFDYRDWGWEQSADTLIAYGWPQQGPYARTDILMPPGESPAYDPLRMDYPLHPMSPLVGPVQRGVAEPAVGALVSFARCSGRGLGGIGLGVQTERPTSELSYMPLLIQGGNALLIQGMDLGMPDETVPFSGELKQAMAAGGHRVGLTAKIGKDALVVTLRAQDPATNAPVEFVKSWPINAEQRKRLLSCPGTILAKDGCHEITPYFDDARRPEGVDLAAPAPGNRWRFEGDEQTYRLYRAMSKLKDDSPASLKELAQAMVKAMDKDPTTQAAAMKAYARSIPRVAKDIRAVKSPVTDLALAELAGTSMTLAFAKHATFSSPALSATFSGPVTGRVAGDVSVTVNPMGTIGIEHATQSVDIAAGKAGSIAWTAHPAADTPAPFRVAARAVIEWEGVTFTLAKEIDGCPSIPRWLTIGPFDNKGGGAVNSVLPPETESYDPQKKYAGKDGKEIGWEKRERRADLPLASEFFLDFASLYGGENAAAYAQTWICCPVETNAVLALGSDDGVVVWLDGERVHSNMVSRGYSSKQDRIPIRLKAGRNKLLVKVAQGAGGWSLCAHVTDAEGRPLDGVTYELTGIPPPSEVPAKIIVSGRTSTAVDIGIAKVEHEAPRTCADRPIPNTSGFEWYVSEHYALKSQMDEEFSRMVLEISELAYPHFQALTGLSLPRDSSSRLGIVYANSAQEIVRAIQGDLGFTWNVNGGGVSWWGAWAAYNYPSGGLHYHIKDLVTHENLHVLQGVVTKDDPTLMVNMGTEGFTYGASQHVYDGRKKQFTVRVFDSAPINHFTDGGIAQLKQQFIPVQDMIRNYWDAGGCLGAVYSHFFWSDPDRWFKWCIWRDEYYHGRVNGETNLEVMEGIFGPLDRLNETWKDWISEQNATFHYISWAFEQDGPWLWSRPSRYGDYTRTDVMEAPGSVPKPRPTRLDYPRNPPPSTVGPVRRGPREPAIGFEIDLSKHPDTGRVGAGFGLENEIVVKPFPEGDLLLDPAAGQPGVNLTLRESSLDSGYAATNSPLWEGAARDMTLSGLPAAATNGLTNAVVAEWNGWWKVDKAGRYFLAAHGDGTHGVWVDDAQVLPCRAEPLMHLNYAPVALEAGVHRVRIRSELPRVNTDFTIGWLDPEKPVPGTVRALIEDGRKLVLDAMVWGEKEKVFPLPERLVKAAEADGYRLGMTVTIRPKALDVVLRARGAAKGSMESFAKSLPLTPAQHDRLLWRNMSLLSRLAEGGYYDLQFGIQPFLDDLPIEEIDLTKPAPANRWRFPAEHELFGLYRAAWRMKDQAPQSLTQLKQAMLAAVDADPERQQAAAELYGESIRAVVADVQSLEDRAVASSTLEELLGVSVKITVNSSMPDRLALNATVSATEHSVTGNIALSASPDCLLAAAPATGTVNVRAGQSQKVQWFWNAQSNAVGMVDIAAVANLECAGIAMSLNISQKVNLGQSVPCWYVMGPFDNPGGAEADIEHAPEKEPFTLSASYPGIGTNGPVTWRRCVRGTDLGIGSDFIVDFNRLYGSPENVAGYAVTWVDSPVETNALLAVGSEDGFVAWVNGDRVGGVLKPARTYASQGDRVPIHLKQGENEIRLKVTLSQYGWKLGAHIIGADGKPAPVKYMLKG